MKNPKIAVEPMGPAEQKAFFANQWARVRRMCEGRILLTDAAAALEAQIEAASDTDAWRETMESDPAKARGLLASTVPPMDAGQYAASYLADARRKAANAARVAARKAVGA